MLRFFAAATAAVLESPFTRSCVVSSARSARPRVLALSVWAWRKPFLSPQMPQKSSLWRLRELRKVTDTPGSETSQDSPETACLDSEQLHSMAVANLKKLASDMGIDTKQLKTKDALIEAICAEEVIPGDECADGPELSAAMPTA